MSFTKIVKSHLEYLLNLLMFTKCLNLIHMKRCIRLANAKYILSIDKNINGLPNIQDIRLLQVNNFFYHCAELISMLKSCKRSNVYSSSCPLSHASLEKSGNIHECGQKCDAAVALPIRHFNRRTTFIFVKNINETVSIGIWILQN